MVSGPCTWVPPTPRAPPVQYSDGASEKRGEARGDVGDPLGTGAADAASSPAPATVAIAARLPERVADRDMSVGTRRR